MKFPDIKFPALAILLVAMFTPLIDREMHGDFTRLTDVVVGVCFVLVVAFIAVAAANTANENRKK